MCHLLAAIHAPGSTEHQCRLRQEGFDSWRSRDKAKTPCFEPCAQLHYHVEGLCWEPVRLEELEGTDYLFYPAHQLLGRSEAALLTYAIG